MKNYSENYILYIRLISKLMRFFDGKGPPLTKEEVEKLRLLHKRFGDKSAFSRHLEKTIEKVIELNEEFMLENTKKQRSIDDQEHKKNLEEIAKLLEKENENIRQQRAREAEQRRLKDSGNGM